MMIHIKLEKVVSYDINLFRDRLLLHNGNYPRIYHDR